MYLSRQIPQRNIEFSLCRSINTESDTGNQHVQEVEIRLDHIVFGIVNIFGSIELVFADRNQTSDQVVVPLPIYLNKGLILLNIAIENTSTVARGHHGCYATKHNTPNKNLLHNYINLG